MRTAALLGVLMAWTPAVLAQDTPQPKYPPGFECASLPAGSERDDCRKTKLQPSSTDQDDSRSVTGAGSETPGTVSPPTVPDKPGSETRDTGPGTNGAGAGVGN